MSAVLCFLFADPVVNCWLLLHACLPAAMILPQWPQTPVPQQLPHSSGTLYLRPGSSFSKVIVLVWIQLVLQIMWHKNKKSSTYSSILSPLQHTLCCETLLVGGCSPPWPGSSLQTRQYRGHPSSPPPAPVEGTLFST